MTARDGPPPAGARLVPALFSEGRAALRGSARPREKRELAVEDDHRPFACPVGNAPDVRTEVDGAHGAVAEPHGNEFLDHRAADRSAS